MHDSAWMPGQRFMIVLVQNMIYIKVGLWAQLSIILHVPSIFRSSILNIDVCSCGLYSGYIAKTCTKSAKKNCLIITYNTGGAI